MKTYLLPSLKLSGVLLIICSVMYPLFIAAVGIVAPGSGRGKKVRDHDRVVGYENVGQKFTDDGYFQGRPSAVDYNAAASGGSNKGGSNPDYLARVQARIDTFLVHNPGIKTSQIPADLVTASGSGLDPHISVQGANVQVPRISRLRKRNEQVIYALIRACTEKPLLGIFGTERVNVLQLNMALNKR
jgi:K+-transporting ATPase ATPase C chain